MEVIDDTGEHGVFEVTLEKGRNVIKMVGQGAKLKELSIPSSFDSSFAESARDVSSPEILTLPQAVSPKSPRAVQTDISTPIFWGYRKGICLKRLTHGSDCGAS